MRTLSFLLASLTLLPQAGATTLLKLSMNDMIQQSTSIVRAKVTGSRGAFRGQDVYTYYQLQILETVKPGAPEPARRRRSPCQEGSRAECGSPWPERPA